MNLGVGATRVEALKGVSLAIEKSRATAIVGPSGCGKSTLLMTIAGLERVASGHVEVAGATLDGMSEDDLAAFRGRTIGVVFQSFHLMPAMTALENVAIPLELAGARDAFARARAELEAVGLTARRDHYPAQLSGGEQQRVALARALVGAPPIVLADEPTGNLDEATGAAVIDLILDQTRRRGATLVLVTHDAALAARCDRQVRMASGRIVGARADDADEADGNAGDGSAGDGNAGDSAPERARDPAAIR